MASLGIGVTSVLAIDLSRDFITTKPELPIPIGMACGVFTRNKVTIRYTQMEDRDVVRYGNFIAAIWRVFGEGRSEE